MKPYKICCLTYKTLDTIVREAVDKIQDPDIEIHIVEGLREEVLEQVNELKKEGLELIIGGGANLKIAREHYDIPCVEYKISAYDYLNAIDLALNRSKSIVIVSYKTPMPSTLEEYLKKRKIDFTNIIYENTFDLTQKLEECHEGVIIGPAHPVEIAGDLGLDAILIYSGKSAIEETVYDSIKMVKELRLSRERFEFAHAIIKNSPNGLILVDSEGQIIECNDQVKSIFNKRMNIQGHNVNVVLPSSGYSEFIDTGNNEVRNVIILGKEEYLCSWSKITDQNNFHIGTLGIFSNLSKIVKAQLDFDIKLSNFRTKKGFIARNFFHDIIGKSKAIKDAVSEAKYCSSSEANVLIHGETGVGKEIFAQSIHNESSRKTGPFLAINCAALPEHLLESELFGYEEGAFTGGRKGGKKGLFELAEHGTVFLDEIGELSSTLQTRLLRVLQEREIMHVGGDRVIPVDIRVISATNKDLENLPIEKFRRDLYYRLNVLELKLPSLRDREKDVVMLFKHFLKEKKDIRHHSPMALTQEISDILCCYNWPGNIRELQNVTERFNLYSSAMQKHNDKFLKKCLVRSIGEERLLGCILSNFDIANQEIDMELIDLLKKILGLNRDQIGNALGISRTTLWRLENKSNVSNDNPLKKTKQKK